MHVFKLPIFTIVDCSHILDTRKPLFEAGSNTSGLIPPFDLGLAHNLTTKNSRYYKLITMFGDLNFNL